MSELVNQWSVIMASLGDEVIQDNIQNTNFSNTPKLEPGQLNDINGILINIVESGGKNSSQKDELLETLDNFHLNSVQLDRINDKFIVFVDSLNTYPDQKDDLLTIMRDYKPDEDGMFHGGKLLKKTKKYRKTKNSRKTKNFRKTRRPRRK